MFEKIFQPSVMQHSSLLGLILSNEENEVFCEYGPRILERGKRERNIKRNVEERERERERERENETWRERK